MEETKLLIIDDDKFLREMYVTKFTSSGFKVDSTISAIEALEKIKGGFVPDVILLDLIMPGMTGWEFLAEANNANLLTNTKVIVLSNQGESQDIEKSKEFKVAGYIVKALKTPSEVVEEVKKVCNM